MAVVKWAEPAIRNLEEIAGHIALDKPEAAARYVKRVLAAVARLSSFPQSGSIPPEIPDLPYRQVIVPPCRILYRVEGKTVWIVHVLRGEKPLDTDDLESSD